jgi:hypothetical protein
MDLLEEQNKSTLVDDAGVFLSDWLFGRHLDKICAPESRSDEVRIYGELGALPKRFRLRH